MISCRVTGWLWASTSDPISPIPLTWVPASPFYLPQILRFPDTRIDVAGVFSGQFLITQIYIGADSQLNGATKNASMGRMKSIQLGGF